jgi:hypothetical protein
MTASSAPRAVRVLGALGFLGLGLATATWKLAGPTVTAVSVSAGNYQFRQIVQAYCMVENRLPWDLEVDVRAHLEWVDGHDWDRPEQTRSVVLPGLSQKSVGFIIEDVIYGRVAVECSVGL